MAVTEKQKERAKKLLGKHLAGACWRWNGSHFSWSTFESIELNGSKVRISVYFTAKVNYLSVCIALLEKHGMPDREKEFTGENAIDEAVTWETEMIYEVMKELERRTEPYSEGYENYLLAMKGQDIRTERYTE